MQTALVCLCLCLLSTALSTPVPPPLPGRAAGNCVGQHRILMKGCDAKHGFYVFKYVYSFSTRRNQTQIKKEEADSRVIPDRQLGEDNTRLGPTEDGAAPEQGDNDSIDVMENRTGPKPENHSTPGVGGDTHSPLPGTSTRARGGVGAASPTLANSEGSGDLDLVIEVDGGVSILPQGPSEVMVGNRSDVRSEDRDDGAPERIPVEGAMTDGMERDPATRGAGDEGSGEATVPTQGQEGVMRGTGTAGAALTSVTEKMENIEVDAKGVDEYAYMPDSGSVTITGGKVGSTVGATSFTHISPDKDDEVNIFIGRANIHVGEQETTQASATLGREDDSISTAGTTSPPPRLMVTAARDSDDDDGIPAHRQPEGLATTATPSHGDSVTSSPVGGQTTGDDEDGATTTGDGDRPVGSGPWRVTGGGITVPAGAGIREKGDDEARGEGQRSEGRPGHLPVTTPRQGDDEEAAATVPDKGASIRLGTTVASPRVSKGDCTTALGMAGGRKAGKGATPGRGGSGEVGPATPQPHTEGQPGAGAKVRPGGTGLDKTPRTDKAPSPHRKAGSQASSGAQASAGGHGGDTVGRPRATEAGGSRPPPAGPAGVSMAVGEGRERGRAGKAGAAAAGAGVGRLPGRHGRRLGAGEPGAFAALGHSRQVDQVKRADELHVRERSFYTLGGAGGGPRGRYTSLGSADSSQSSEGERGSQSDSRQAGVEPAGWGAPGHPHGRWSRGAL